MSGIVRNLPGSVDPRLFQAGEYMGRWGGAQGPLGSGTLALTSDTAYFVFLGRVTVPFTPAYAKGFCQSAGSGAQTAELGFFSTPAYPNAANQTVSKIVATGTITSLTGTGVKQNTAAFTTVILPGTFLWWGMRTAMAGSQPTMNALNRDYARGNILTTATAGALTGAGPWTGAVVAASAATAEAPVAWWGLDA